VADVLVWYVNHLSNGCSGSSRGDGSSGGDCRSLAVDLSLSAVAGDVAGLAASVAGLASFEPVGTSRCCSTVTADVSELATGLFDQVSI
jgi:hypothetical protein